MKTYLVLIRGGNPGFARLDEAGQQALYGKWIAYIGKLNEGGNWVKGNPLDDSGRLLCGKKEPAEGVVGDDDISVGGYLLIEAENYDAALRLCDACPTFEIGGKLEIREAIEM